MKRMLAAVLVATSALTVGCGSGGFTGLYGAPLPGGADLGEHPYRLTAEFGNVMDLVPQAAVKVNEVTVGKVTGISLAGDNKTARVTLWVNGDVRLPANATAELRQSSLLGEKYVQLARPDNQQASGRLRDGAVIKQASTNRNVEIEEVLGALSMLLNGGGVAQLRDITRELNDALAGNEPEVKSLLNNIRTLVSNLSDQRHHITRAIDGLGRLSGTLNRQKDNIATTLDRIGPGIKVLNEQRDELVSMLQALDRLSGTMVDTMHKAKDDLVADLKAIAPTVDKLAEAGSDLPKSLQILATFPFTDYAATGAKGDYFNVNIDANLNLTDVVENITSSPHAPIPLLDLKEHQQHEKLLPLPGTNQREPGGAAGGGPAPGDGQGGLNGLLGNLLGGGR